MNLHRSNCSQDDLSHSSFIKTSLNSSECIAIVCSLLVAFFVMDNKINDPCQICSAISKLPLRQAASFHCLRAGVISTGYIACLRVSWPRWTERQLHTEGRDGHDAPIVNAIDVVIRYHLIQDVVLFNSYLACPTIVCNATTLSLIYMWAAEVNACEKIQRLRVTYTFQ